MSSLSIIITNSAIGGVHKILLKGFTKSFPSVNESKEAYCILTKEISNYNVDLEIEIEDTIRFLNQHKNKLIQIKAIKGIKAIKIIFTSKSILNKGASIKHDFYFPSYFIKICGELGLSIEYNHPVQILDE